MVFFFAADVSNVTDVGVRAVKFSKQQDIRLDGQRDRSLYSLATAWGLVPTAPRTSDTHGVKQLKGKLLFLLAGLILVLGLTGCSKIEARMAIREGNDAYQKEQYRDALVKYEEARKLDPGFVDLDRMIGYSAIGSFEPGNETPENAKMADKAVEELQRYLKKRPNDETAREALVNLFLNAERTSQAIDYFKEYLKEKPADLNAVRSIATLYAKSGDFNESLNWYKKITLLDSKNPEAFYTFGVVCYEKVAKNPPDTVEESRSIIEQGKSALIQATKLRADYFEALVFINLLYREESKTYPDDPAKQAELMAQAEVYRNQAVEITRARKRAEEEAKPAPPAEQPAAAANPAATE